MIPLELESDCKVGIMTISDSRLWLLLAFNPIMVYQYHAVAHLDASTTSQAEMKV